MGLVAEMGGACAFDADRERPEAEVAAVCTEPACEDRIDTGDGSCEEAREEREFAS